MPDHKRQTKRDLATYVAMRNCRDVLCCSNGFCFRESCEEIVHGALNAAALHVRELTTYSLHELSARQPVFRFCQLRKHQRADAIETENVAALDVEHNAALLRRR